MVVVEVVEEEDSVSSMVPASAILENCWFNAFSGMEYIIQEGNR